MNMKNASQMTVAELVREGADLRKKLSESANQLSEVYRALHTKMRRQPADDETSTYLMLASMGQRLAGMVIQGVKRSSSVDRLVDSLPTEEEKEQANQLNLAKEARVKAEEERVMKELNTRISDDDILSLYGEDF
jgi:hypothetical protein